MGKNGSHSKAELDLHPNFEVVAICDINKSVSREFPDLSFSDQWEDVLGREDRCGSSLHIQSRRPHNYM